MWSLRLTLLYFYLAVSLGKPQESAETIKNCSTTSDSIDPSTKCVFPFIYKGLEHFGCPVDPEDNSRRWCSTEVDENGEHVSGKEKYGFCLDTCPTSLNIDDFVVLNEALPDQQTTICDLTACNGLLMKFAESTGLNGTLGQCSVSLDGESFCFVNEDSSCPKQAFDGKPGSFVSSKPCTDPKAPSKRFVITGIIAAIAGAAAASAAATKVGVTVAVGIGAGVGGAHIAKAVKKG